jgi:hypothetical protein
MTRALMTRAGVDVEGDAMMQPIDRSVDRREFLKQGGIASLAAAGSLLGVRAAIGAGEDPPNTHNMLVVGEKAVFLSHLPMFDGVDASGTKFVSPHRFQVILEGVLTDGGKDISELYLRDRREHPDTRIYTLNPNRFVLTRLFTPAEKPRQTSFTATVFRGHLEQGGRRLPGLEEKTVTVSRVIHAREFDPRVRKPEQLEYIVFGKGADLLLAHTISGPPDFDHVLSARIEGRELTDADLKEDVRLVIPDRKNAVGDRLREDQRVPAIVRVGASGEPAKVEVRVGRQFYFEEGELQVPPTFDPTPEEKQGA